MELRHLRYFVAVAEETTFIKAAQRLRVAQPALSRQIRDLERTVGAALFERGRRQVRLTPAGEVSLRSARHILAQTETAIDRARRASAGLVGRCVLCVGRRAFSNGWLARIVAAVHAVSPEIDVVVLEEAVRRQWDALSAGEADIGVGAPPPIAYPDLAHETMSLDPMNHVLLPRAHPLAARSSLTLDDLRTETFAFFDTKGHPDVERQIRREFARLAFTPVRRKKFDGIHPLASYVASGQGWTLTFDDPDPMLRSDLASVPLADFRLTMPWSVLWRVGERRPVARTVIEAIRRADAAGRGLPVPTRPPDDAPSDDGAPPSSVDWAAQQVELRHLRYFRAVAEAPSFGRAAARLGLTQPGLSRQIRDLERAVGVELLERDKRGSAPTAAGDSFLRDLRRILDEADAMRAEVERALRGMQSRCLIGAVPTRTAQSLLNALVRECARTLPKLELVVDDLPTPKQAAALLDARIDLGICHSSPGAIADNTRIRRDRLLDDLLDCAVVADDSPLARRDSIALHELADLPFLFMTRAFQPAFHDLIWSAFRERGFEPLVENTYEGLNTVWTLAAEGRGWGVAFRSQVGDPPPGCAVVPIANLSLPWGLDSSVGLMKVELQC